MKDCADLIEELKRIRRVSDMLCTSHAELRDRYARKAMALDLLTLASSTWVVALAFVDPTIAVILTPFRLTPAIWLGVLSVSVFFFSLLQLKTDWKSRADAHSRTLDLYAEVKREAGYLLASDECDEVSCRRVFSRYDLASAVGISVPESKFLQLKKRHRLKLSLSKALDQKPGLWIWLYKLRLAIQDNSAKDENGS